MIVVWECQLTPKRIDQTMNGVELLLNEKLLSLYSKHKPFLYHTKEESSLPMAAEESGYGKHSSFVAGCEK